MAKHTETKAKLAATTAAVAHNGHHEFYHGQYVAKGRKCMINTKGHKSPYEAWSVEAMGQVPSPACFDVTHAIQRHLPGCETLYVAMCLRPEGCTTAQFLAAGWCGTANNNKRKLIDVARVVTPDWLPGSGRGRAVRLYLTALGEQHVKAALGKVPAGFTKAAAKPAKVRAPRAPKAKVAVPAEVQPAEVTQAAE